MLHQVLFAGILILAAGGATATATESTPAAAMPRLHTVNLAGRARISMDGEPEEIAERSWPYIPSGATVQIVSGRARFDTDIYARILAKKGCGFFFASHEAEGSRAAALHIAAAGNCKTPLDINVAGQRLLLGGGSAVAIAWTGRRELTIRPEEGEVKLPEGIVRKEGTLLLESEGGDNETLRAGDSLLVRAPNDFAASSAPVAALEQTRLIRKGRNAFEVRREGSDVKREEKADPIIAKWAPAAQQAAEWAIEKYGPPDELSSKELTWIGKGAWKRTTIRSEELSEDLPLDRWNVLEQRIAFAVPRARAKWVEGLHIGVRADANAGELTTISDAEETNFLAVNLAAEVLRGERDAKQARDIYYRQRTLWDSGKSSPYLEGPSKLRSAPGAHGNPANEARR